MTNFLVVLFAVSSLLLGCNGQASGGSNCGPAVPYNIRVWAIPPNLFDSGPPSSGFFVQLLNALQNVTGIPYTLTLHPEISSGFGNQNNGSFNGTLIGALVNNQADLIGTELTITEAREAVVDFLLPFAQYHLEIVVNKNSGNGPIQYLSQANVDLTYLQNSKNYTLNQIYANIEAGRPGSIVTTYGAADPVAKVAANASVAYVGESILINAALAAFPYNAAQVTVQPDNLGTFYVALAVQQGSALREKLNLALLTLAESGQLQEILSAAGFT